MYDEDQKNGLIPFLLLDGHQSRFHLEFLEYINDDLHRWNVCLGVPYGTSYWQIGDSSKRNGVFKMILTKEKAILFNTRIDKFNKAIHLQRCNIIPLVRKSWPKAFANVMSNKKAIAERGWFPFNRVLLLHPDIRATITQDDLKSELELGLFPLQRMNYESCSSELGHISRMMTS